MRKRILAIMMILCFVTLSVSACGDPDGGKSAETTAETTAVVTNLPQLDMTKWRYNEEEDIYCQIGVAYCETPADESYEKLSVFVPGAYMDAVDNGDGTYTCRLKEDAQINGYTPTTAPMIMPINTGGYAADKALTENFLEYPGFMEEVGGYTSQGFVFVHAGCRGIHEGVPSGVTDLKAAVRYLRYADDVIAGDAEHIFTYGTSGGGAQSEILGASGNSALYDPYLEKIGAVQGVSDAIAGSMGWCPVTDVDTGNAEYEWMMGCTRKGRTAQEKAISDDLANVYVEYLNSAGFTDEDGNALTLTKSEKGIYQAGTYYEYLKRVIERSLNNYLSDTNFTNGSAQDYIDELNKDKKWVTYDKSTNTATISSVEDFVKTCKPASDYFVAFDWPHTQNTLFGYGDGKPAHFDSVLADILKKENSEYADEYIEDLKKTDALGYTVKQRLDMYTPLYFLMKGRDGYGTSTVAKYWRIRTGIQQNTNALTTEVNLALALNHCDGVKSVDFETVWKQGHTEAERTGSPSANFIEWVNTCMKSEK